MPGLAVTKYTVASKYSKCKWGKSRNLFTRSNQTTRQPKTLPSSTTRFEQLKFSTIILSLTPITSFTVHYHGGQPSLSRQPRLTCVSENDFHSSMRHILTFLFSAIFNSSADPNTAVSQPILQCVQVKPLMGQQGAPERFRVVFSDINNFVQSMLATRKHPSPCCFASPQCMTY